MTSIIYPKEKNNKTIVLKNTSEMNKAIKKPKYGKKSIDLNC